MTTTTDEARFTSLTALKAAHSELLHRRRANGETAELLDEAILFVRRAQATGVLLDEEDERATAQSLITYWANLLYRAGRDPVEAVLAEFDAAFAPELPDELCPYVGLDAFRERDQERFFGRGHMVRELVERLHHVQLLVVVGPSGSGKSSVVRAGLIPALRDGALSGSEHWRYLPPIVPGSDPLAALARLVRLEKAAHLSADGTAVSSPGQHAVGRESGRRFLENPRALDEALDAGGTTSAVVVVDQFEELFTLVDDERIREAFVANLLALNETPEPRHVVILTIRGDFESFLARLPALEALLGEARIQMLPLSAGEVREAIEAPAAAVGLKFDPGVVDRLLQDILGEPAGLPLLQFTLLKLWEAREHNRVTMAAYERVGGGRRALARSADAFYAALIPEEQVTARRILLRMVRPGEGLEVTSNRVLREALYQGGEDPGRIDRVLDKLVAARLVRVTPGDTPADEQIEVAHEALVRNWPTLVEWLENERMAIAMRRRLEARAAEWVRLGSGESGLLDETQLRETERWLASPEARYLGYDPALAALVEASKAAIVAAEREQEAARQRELAQARALAEEQRLRADAERQRAEERGRAITLQRRLSMALAIMSLLVVGLLTFALSAAQRERDTEAESALIARQGQAAAETARAEADINAQRADTERQRAVLAGQTAEAERQAADAARQVANQQEILARAGRLAAQSQQQMSERLPQTSLLLAVESMNLANQAGESETLTATDTISQTLGNALSGYGSLGLASASMSSRMTAIALNADGSLLLAGSEDGTVRFWDTSAEAPTLRAELQLGCPISKAVLSATGWAIMGCSDGRVSVSRIDALDGARLDLPAHAEGLTALALSPNGERLATGGQDRKIFVYNLTTPDPSASRRVIENGGDPGALGIIRALTFSPSGRWLVSGSEDGATRVWDLNRTDPLSPQYPKARFSARAVVISPDGRWLAIAGSNQRIDLWGFSESTGFDAQRPIQLYGRARDIRALAFDDTSRWLITGNEDGTARLWDLSSVRPGEDPLVLSGHTGKPITAMATRGRWLITASEDGTARRWDLQSEDAATTSVVLGGHNAAVTTVTIDASGDHVATGGDDGMARFWRGSTAPLPSVQGQLAELACQTVGRNMTQGEWTRFFAGQPYRKTCSQWPEGS